MSEPVVTSLDDLLTCYRYFLIDQFGVLHNGRTPYTGAAAALQKINESDAQAIIISNSGKRSAVNEQRMATLGFPRHSYHAMITSGETAWHRLHEMMQTGAIKAGTRCYLLSNDADTSSIDGLGLDPTDQIDDADLVMLSGLRGTTEPLHKVRQSAGTCHRKRHTVHLHKPGQMGTDWQRQSLWAGARR